LASKLKGRLRTSALAFCSEAFCFDTDAGSRGVSANPRPPTVRKRHVHAAFLYLLKADLDERFIIVF
jgi:hypothetical protein